MFRRLDLGRRHEFIDGKRLFRAVQGFQHGRKGQIARQARHRPCRAAMALDGLVRLAIHSQQPRIEKSVEAGLALFLTLAVGGLQNVARSGGVAVRGPVERQEGIEERTDIAVFLRQAGGHLQEGRHVASLHGIQRRRIGGDADRQAIGPYHGRRARRRGERHRALDKRRRDWGFF